MDIYLPSLTIIMDYFSVNYDEVQFSLSVFLIGVGVFQLILGPLSDKYGRRPILFAGLVVYWVATLACAYSTSIEMLNIARFIQSIGACATGVTSFAVARDLFDGKQGAKMIASVTSAIGLVPVLAPMLGTYLQIAFGWRSNFIFLLAFSVMIFILAYFRLQETNTHQPPPLKHIFKNYWQLLSHPAYRIYSMCGVFAFGSLIAFASNAPFYMIKLGGASITEFSFLFGINAAAFIMGSFIASRLIHKLSLETLIFVGGNMILLGGVLQAALLSFLSYSNLWIVISMLICTFGIAIVMPVGSAGALAPFRHIAGTASALSGFLRFIGGSLIGVLVGFIETFNSLALAGELVIAGGVIVFAINKLRVAVAGENDGLRADI
jgi:DHA1 family bicyclomycin/chloramphenicol resistance-like MFS transporter